MKCKTCLINSTCIDPCNIRVTRNNVKEFLVNDFSIKRLIKYHEIKKLYKIYMLSKNIEVKVSTWYIRFYKNENLHRDGDEPAVIFSDGTKEWWKDGKRHRDGNEPSIICSNGYKAWHKNGKFIMRSEK